MEPIAELLDLPEGYGRATEPLGWASVRSRLEDVQHYWLATSRPDGRPHVVPLEGIWVDDTWYYGGGEDTIHSRTGIANPNVVMHLGDGLEAVIVEGEVQRDSPSRALADRLAGLSRKKYGYAPATGAYEKGVPMLVPRRVLAWRAFPKDATRFRFGDQR